MIQRKGRIRRQAIIAGSVFGTVADMIAGMWRSPEGRRWMIPLAVLLGTMGLILTLAVSVEAIAPFIYSIF